MKLNKGTTTIEMIGITLVVSIVLSLGAIKARQHMIHGEYERIKLNAGFVTSALNGFYEQYCSNSSHPTPTIANLVSLGFLSDRSLASNPIGNEFEVEVDWTSPASLTVSTRLTGQSGASVLNYVSATRAGSTTLYWDSQPTLLTSFHNFQNMQTKHMFEPGVCE